jgi:enoyl-CoA hydratase
MAGHDVVTMSDIVVARDRGLGIVTLNRPQALNTLTLGMYRQFEAALAQWVADPAMSAVLVRGAGDRAFCAGGDVIAIYEARRTGVYNSDFFREEYQLIRRIHRLPKPYVALMTGVTMGGGAGVAINGMYRVASERTVFAMPEVHIGLFPDVGASRFLTRVPGRIGLYLALTGKRLGPADTLALGFAAHFVPHERLSALTDAIADASRAVDARTAIEAALARFAGDPGAASLPPLREAIDRAFAGDSVEAIVADLARESGDWAKEALDAIRRASPLSVKITFEQLRRGKGMEIEDALTLEYRMTQHVLAAHDFFEGIRAVLVDKDRNPRWQHASLEAVSAAEVESYFAPIGARELAFA